MKLVDLSIKNMKQNSYKTKTMSHCTLGRAILVNYVGAVALIVSACATPIGVTRVDPRTAEYELIDNMSPSNTFLKNLVAIPIANGVVANSIIAGRDAGR